MGGPDLDRALGRLDGDKAVGALTAISVGQAGARPSGWTWTLKPGGGNILAVVNFFNILIFFSICTMISLSIRLDLRALTGILSKVKRCEKRSKNP
jgi:hypothetical protein